MEIGEADPAVEEAEIVDGEWVVAGFVVDGAAGEEEVGVDDAVEKEGVELEVGGKGFHGEDVVVDFLAELEWEGLEEGGGWFLRGRAAARGW